MAQHSSGKCTVSTSLLTYAVVLAYIQNKTDLHKIPNKWHLFVAKKIICKHLHTFWSCNSRNTIMQTATLRLLETLLYLFLRHILVVGIMLSTALQRVGCTLSTVCERVNDFREHVVNAIQVSQYSKHCLLLQTLCLARVPWDMFSKCNLKWTAVSVNSFPYCIFSTVQKHITGTAMHFTANFERLFSEFLALLVILKTTLYISSWYHGIICTVMHSYVHYELKHDGHGQIGSKTAWQCWHTKKLF